MKRAHASGLREDPASRALAPPCSQRSGCPVALARQRQVRPPPLAAGARSIYLKLRDRASYEFALASAAVVATVGGARMQRIRIAMGGTATKPWRNLDVERTLSEEGGSDKNS